MFGRKPKTTTPQPQVEQLAPESAQPPDVEDAMVDALDAINPVLVKLYDDAYARAVSDVLATLQDRIDELEHHVLGVPEDRYSAGLLSGLKDAVVTVEAMS